MTIPSVAWRRPEPGSGEHHLRQDEYLLRFAVSGERPVSGARARADLPFSEICARTVDLGWVRNNVAEAGAEARELNNNPVPMLAIILRADFPHTARVFAAVVTVL